MQKIDHEYLSSLEKRGEFEWQVYWAALHYAEAGLYVIPLEKGGKKLLPRRFNISYGQASKKPKTIEKWFSPDGGKFVGHNIGLATGKEDGIFAIDVDRHGASDGFAELESILLEENEEIDAPCQITPNGGKHYIFQWQENAASSTGKIAPSIDTRGGTETMCKGHIVTFPSIVGGMKYKWESGGEIPFIPKWALTKLGIVWRPKQYTNRGSENVAAEDMEQKIPEEQLKRMLDAIDPNELSYDEWLKVGQAINTQFSTDVGLQIWDRWSARGDRYKANECHIRWNGFDPSGPVRVGSLFYYAKQSGWEPQKDDVKITKSLEVIERLNAEFAIVVVGGKIRILREKETYDTTGSHYDLMDKDSFRTLLQNDIIPYVDKNGKTKIVSVADLWLASEMRRTFPNGLRLMPDKKGHNNGYYNTWNGFAVEPRKGSCSLLLEHIFNVVCNADQEIYAWVMDWCADAVQDPANPKGTCIVMRGKEGAGKGTLANTMGELFGSHYLHLIDEAHLLGNFNAHMIDSVFVFADEVTFGGNVKASGKLKGMVTEEWLIAERKGIDAVGYRNMVHLMIASNGSWVIPASTDSRRWCVLDVNDTKIMNQEYWQDMYYEINNGGREAFLHYLLNRDISSNLRRAPVTKALQHQQMKSLRFNSVVDWWVGILMREKLMTPDVDASNHGGWPSKVIKADLYDEYKTYCQNNKQIAEHIVNFGKELKLYGFSDFRTTINGTKIRGTKVPPLEIAIHKAEKLLGIKLDEYEGE